MGSIWIGLRSVAESDYALAWAAQADGSVSRGYVCWLPRQLPQLCRDSNHRCCKCQCKGTRGSNERSQGHRLGGRRSRRRPPGVRKSVRLRPSLANPDANLEITAESCFEEGTLGAHDGPVGLELAASASNGYVGVISTGKKAMQRCIVRGSTKALRGQLLDLPRRCHVDS